MCIAKISFHIQFVGNVHTLLYGSISLKRTLSVCIDLAGRIKCMHSYTNQQTFGKKNWLYYVNAITCSLHVDMHNEQNYFIRSRNK